MKNRWIATLVLVVLALAAALPAASTLLPTAAAEPVVASMTMSVNETYQIKTSSIAGAEGKQLVFATSNKRVATVSAEGVITAVNKGTAKIAVGYDDTALAVCTVRVLGAPKKLMMQKKNLALNAGETGQVAVKFPKGTGALLTYESSDTAVATVAADGKVTAVAPGHAVITAATANGKTASCAVLVLEGKAPAVLKVGVENLPMQPGETFKLTPGVEDGAQALYAFSSSNKKVATVNAEGEITAKRKGKAKITVTTHNGLTATVNVVVRGKMTNLYGALTDNPKAFLKAAKKLKMKKAAGDDTQSVTYHNGQAALTMTPNACRVTLIPAEKPQYTIEGIDATITAELAAAKLVAAGWTAAGTKTVDGVEVRGFAKEGDTAHLITISVEGSEIRSVDAYWTW